MQEPAFRSITCGTSRNSRTCFIGNNDGRSEYNSLQVRLQRQIGALRVTANYTWSKSIDNDQSAATGGEGNGFAAPLDSFNESLVRGRSNFDIPNAFTMTGLYTLPIGRGQRFGAHMSHWLDTLIGGWDVGGLWIWESGSPFTSRPPRLRISRSRSLELTAPRDATHFGGPASSTSILRL